MTGTRQRSARQRMTRRERRLLAEVETSPLAWELCELVRERAPDANHLHTRRITRLALDGRTVREEHRDCWTSPASWLLDKLNERAAAINKNAEEWPKTPQQLGCELNKLKEGLESKGVRVSYVRHGIYGRLWTLTAVAAVGTPDANAEARAM